MSRPGRTTLVKQDLGRSLRILRSHDLPPGFEELAADATADDVRILDVVREDWAAGTMRFDGPGEALFVAMVGQALVGLCGLTRDPYTMAEGLGRVRRLYVRRATRRAGAGRALLDAVAGQAREMGYARLRARAPVSAFAFYERSDFLRLVGEPCVTHVRLL